MNPRRPNGESFGTEAGKQPGEEAGDAKPESIKPYEAKTLLPTKEIASLKEQVILYQNQIRALVNRQMAKDFPTAEINDATSDVMVRVLENLDDFRGDCSLRTWIYRITLNIIADRFRALKRDPVLRGMPFKDPSDIEGTVAESGIAPRSYINEPISSRTPGESSYFEHRAEIVKQVINEMPLGSQHREILSLHFLDDLDSAQIAKILRINTNAVRQRIYRAKKEFKKMLKPFEKDLKG